MNDIRLYENIAELSEQFPLKLRRYRTRQLYLHWHEHIELLHLLDGEGTFVVNGETVTAHAGETVAVNSNSLHTFRADEEMDYLCLIANPASLKLRKAEIESLAARLERSIAESRGEKTV